MKIVCSLLLLCGLARTEFLQATEPLMLQKTISLPNVRGRIDHLAFDEAGHRLFVAALGNNTVEVVDLSTGKVARSLTGFAEPQGVLYRPETQRLYVANGADGTVRVWDTQSFVEVAKLQVGDDADNLRYDAAAKQILVGYGSGALGFIEEASAKVVSTISLHGHPESFQLEKSGRHIFVNVPGAHEVAVVDRATQKQIGAWRLGFAAANYPLALDEAHQRAFVACRLPARILVFNTETGAEIAKLELHGDCDDLFYDSAQARLYATCGEGYIDIVHQDTPDRYSAQPSVKTEPKARTGLWAAGTLYLAVPQQQGREAHLNVYTPAD